jgi:anti-anti-sigma factor
MVEVTHEHDWAVVRLEGDVDVATAPPLRDAVERLQAGGERYVRFDASRVEFMDSQGLNLLAGAYKRAQALGGRIEVVGASSELRTVFTLTGLDWLLAPDEGEASAVRDVAREERPSGDGAH